MQSLISGQTIEIGYEYHNAILTLNTVALVFFVIFAKIIVWISLALFFKMTEYSVPLKKCKRKYLCCVKLKKRLNKDLLFGDIINPIMGAFFEIAISTIYTI